jgi:uncharacterized OsmC-like protein
MPEPDDTIKTALERNVKAVSLRPSVGQGTATTLASLRPGLACEVTEGKYSLTVGMTEKYGGTGAGPNPGVFGRAALASCLTLGLAMWAARMGVELTSLEVEVQADYDVRGELGVTPEVRPGYLAMRYRIRVGSPAPEAVVREMLATGIQTSSWIDTLANPVPMSGDIEFVSSADA